MKTKPGRGRKALLDLEVDKEFVLQAIKANRQRTQTAKAEWEQETNKSVSLSTFKSFGGRYKRIRKRCNAKPCPELYALKKEQLAELEKLFEQGFVDLFYGDESQVCSTGYVPYGWQFPGEEVSIGVEKG